MTALERVHKRITRGGRRLLGRLLGATLGVAPRSAAAAEALPDRPRILLVRLNFRLGNLLLITPALHALAERWPEARVTVLCGDRYACVLDRNPAVSEVWTLSRPHPRRLLADARVLRRLLAARFDLAIDGGLGQSLTGALAVRLSRAPLTVGGAGTPYSRLFRLRAAPPPPRSHRIEGLLGMLGEIGVACRDLRLRIYLAPEERAWAAERWRRYGLDGRRVVGLNLGARSDKKWPVGRFVELARRLETESGARCLFFVGPEDERRVRELGRERARDLLIDRTFAPRRFAALLERCDVVVSADTGPMHLAAAAGTPVVALFRRDNVEEFRPLGPEHRVLHDPQGPAVGAVAAATAELLDAARPARIRTEVRGG